MRCPYPAFNEGYIEWIDLLESVVAARKSYTMIELGAGMGRWAVRAASAVRHYNPNLPFRLIAVEAEPTHFEWMRLHFADNDVDPNQHSLLYAAVSDVPRRSFVLRGNGMRGDRARRVVWTEISEGL